MRNWEHKHANTLADAIAKHIVRHPELVEDNELLAIINQVVKKSSNTVTTKPYDLSRQRAVVCAICRGSKLYECDVPAGWSQNCAFISANTTEFGGL
jgi:hypothetical protein